MRFSRHQQHQFYNLKNASCFQFADWSESMRWPHQWHQSKGSSEVNLTKVTDFGDSHSELHLPRYWRPSCLAHPGPVAKVQMLQRAMPVTWRCFVESPPDGNWPCESWGFFGRASYRLLLKHWSKRHTCVVGDSTKKGSHQFIRKKKKPEHAGFLSRWKPLALDKSPTFSGTSPRVNVEDWTSRGSRRKTGYVKKCPRDHAADSATSTDLLQTSWDISQHVCSPPKKKPQWAATCRGYSADTAIKCITLLEINAVCDEECYSQCESSLLIWEA